MKKLIKVMVLVLSMIFVFSFTACSSDDNVGDEKELGANHQFTKLADFESFDEIMHVELSQRFGKLERNSEKTFVTSGDYSMAVSPYGDFEAKIQPSLTLMLNNKFINKVDFTKTVYVVFDVYNTADVEKEIQVFFISKDENRNNVYTPMQSYLLQPNCWNKVVYGFNDGAMVNSYCLDFVERMNVVFKDYRQNSDKYNPTKYYFDNLNCFDIEGFTFDTNREGNKITSFENLQDVYLLRRSSNCNITVNANKMYVSEGNISAKIEKFDSNNCSITLCEKIIAIDKFINASQFSVDIINGSDVVGYYTLAMYYMDELGEERQVNFSKAINGCENGTIVVEASDLPDCTFESITHIELQIASSTLSYIDNVCVD